MPRSMPVLTRLSRPQYRRSRTRIVALLLPLAAPAVLMACADDPSDARPATGDVADVSSAPPPAIVPTTVATEPSSGDGSAADRQPAGEPVVVQALDNTFRPDAVTVAVGTPVRFDNVGRNDHDVIPVVDGEEAEAPTTGPDGWGVAAEDFVPGDSYTHVFERPGVYEYVCTIHGVAGVGMIGTVTVTP